MAGMMRVGTKDVRVCLAHFFDSSQAEAKY